MRNRFSLWVLLRLLIIVGGTLLLTKLWGNLDLLFTQILLGLMLLGMLAELLQFINRTNQELTKFLDAIEYEDHAVHFSLSKLGGSFSRLEESFRRILEKIQNAQVEKEAQLGFLQVLLEQIPVGVLAIREGESIELMNNQAGQLLHSSYTTQWSYLKRIRPEFCSQLEGNDVPGQQTIHITVGNQSHALIVNHHQVKMLSVHYTLITFQDIGPQMDRQELEAWQKLIRILTHEIMNSITPLSSLTDTLLMILHTTEGIPKGVSDLRPEDLDDVRYSIQTIRDRSQGLMRFVEDYRRLYKVPTPVKQTVNLDVYFNNLHRLLGPQLEAAQCDWHIDIRPNTLKAHWDASLLQQVFINLITNALQAMEGQSDPAISIIAEQNHGHLVIAVCDQGPGIPDEKLDKIFVPFFTTKVQGSGIGLSLSRQILFQHEGQLTAHNSPHKGAIFSLTIPPPP